MTNSTTDKALTVSTFTTSDALAIEKQCAALRKELSGVMNTLAIYNDPDDYRTPMFQARLAEVSSRVARVNAALTALQEALA